MCEAEEITLETRPTLKLPTFLSTLGYPHSFKSDYQDISCSNTYMTSSNLYVKVWVIDIDLPPEMNICSEDNTLFVTNTSERCPGNVTVLGQTYCLESMKRRLGYGFTYSQSQNSMEYRGVLLYINGNQKGVFY